MAWVAGARLARGLRPCAGPGAQPTRRVGERLAYRVVALADAGEAGGEGHVRHGEVGGLQQDSRRLAALCPGQGERPRPDFRRSEAVELPGAVAQPARQSLDALPVDHAVADQPHGAGHDIGPDVPLR